MKKKILIFILCLLTFAYSFSQETTEEIVFETPYVAEGSIDELIQLKEAGDIKTFQEKLEDLIVSVFPSLQPPVISDVKIEDITTNSVTISWKTNVKSNSIVALVEDKDYDPKKEYPFVVEIGNIDERVKDHKVTISNLKPGTLYYFQVKSASIAGVVGKSKHYSFTTKASKIKLEIGKLTNSEIEVKWISPQPTNSFIEYKDLKTGKVFQEKLDELTTIHSMIIKNLSAGREYLLRGYGFTEKGVLIETDEVVVKTKVDVTPPKIYDLRISNALLSAGRNQALTIVAWRTDEPANSIVYYETGLGISKELENKTGKEDEFVTDHVVIIPTKAGTIYRIKISSTDTSGNKAESGIRTVLTPRTEESILEIIIKNFEETFKFLRKR